MSIAALIVAAGRGTRAGGDVPKQYAALGRMPVFCRTIEALATLDEIDRIQVVVREDDLKLYWDGLERADWDRGRAEKVCPPAIGGATRQASVLNGLLALSTSSSAEPSPPPELVLIHDAARPFVDVAAVRSIIAALAGTPGAIAAVPIADTLKRSDAAGAIAATIDRTDLWAAQTPQGFHFQAILDAHRHAAAKGRADFTDDAAVAEWAGLAVALVTSTTENFKITTAADLARARRIVAEEQRSQVGHAPFETRTGTGFDVHRLVEGDHVWLCGVKIPHDARLEGHSDADVALHALTDAILGALGDGDIGQHFPPSDPQWKGAASRVFLADAARRVRERGGRISNVDVTLLCEAPRIAPHRDMMLEAIAGILGIDVGRVAVKATTTEGLGFTGRREGIAAMASATLLVPA